MSDKAPAYQWYPKDAETDETYRLMSYEQQGIYRALLDHQWLEGSLPKDPSVIARLVPKIHPGRFLRLWPGIEPCFTDDGSGRLINPRLERQRDELVAFIAGQKVRGRAGGLAKAKARKDSAPSETVAALDKRQPVASDSPVANPSSSSPVSYLLSAKREEKSAHAPPTKTGSGAFGSALPRAHLRHTLCGRVCLHEEQFGEFVRKLGGDPETADMHIRGWATRLLEEWDRPPKLTQVIQGTTFQWWAARWEEWQGTPTAGKRLTQDPVLMDAGVLALLKKDGTIA